MWKRVRSPSLFWTFAGAFLAVMLLALVFQAIFVITLIGPMVRSKATSDAESLGQSVALRIESSLARGDAINMRRILALSARDERRLPVFYVDENGEVLRGERRGRGPGNRPQGSVPFLEKGPPPRTGEELLARIEGQDEREHVVVRTPVTVDGDPRGEVIVLVPVHQFSPLRPFPIPRDVPRPGLLFLPLATVLSAAAGLWMFRGITRRIRALEVQAKRVADGDLEQRVPDLGADELGKLGESVNEMTASLSESRLRLEEAEAQRRRFLADVTHELSTPLTSIRGYAETLTDPEVPVSDAERATYHGHILEEAERMDLLIADLLDLARLEAGAIEFQIVRLDLAELVRHSVDRFRSRFEKASLQLSYDGPGGPATLEADGRRIELVVDNLLGNCLRHVPEGRSVDVTVRVNEKTASLLVEDDGIGFPETDLPHVFDRFYRADDARPAGGTGLGLAIVRETVHRHGGVVTARNREGGGAAIEILLPREQESGLL